MTTRPGLVASFFTLSGAGFAEPPRNSFIARCEAAAAAGFSGIGLHYDDLARTVSAGTGVSDMRSILRNNGLALVEIEFLSGWALSPVGAESASTSLAGIEAVATALGGRHVSAGEFGADIRLDTEAARDRAAKALRANADRLGRRGLLVALEAFPWSALANTDIAIDLLRRADAPNAGLLIDVWHFYNGGARPEQLVDLPAAGITAFQLNDGLLVHENFRHHARTGRELPGEGELDVVGLIQAAQRAGFAGPYCVESNTPELRALPVAEAARRAADAATGVLRAAGVAC
ncbi:sugar phosphate isomerase/epimerase family protein [Mycolicibacterium sp.]|uniref:sugar phosphate isomerase/epimerase family protein n=1 Tax=Mycolicibacterium sp. TaxID=2320850 RepID=UPI0037C83F34